MVASSSPGPGPDDDATGPPTPRGAVVERVATSTREVALGVDVVDITPARVHHPGDLLTALLSAVGALLVVVLATWAQNTTSGVAEDVQGFAVLLRRILFVPVSALISLVTLMAPVVVLGELALRRLGRQMLLGLAGAAAAVLLNDLVRWGIAAWGSDTLVRALSVYLRGDWQLSLPGYVATLAGLLSAVGPHRRRRSVTWSWNALWAILAVTLITGQVSLPGAAVSLLVGRVVGVGLRYLGGIEPDRAYGTRLISGVRRSGSHPARLIRVPDSSTTQPLPTPDPVAAALARTTGNRVYALTTADGARLDLVVADGDRQVIGVLARLWRSLRMRGLEGRSVVSLRQAVERSALLAYAARAAGVNTPRLLSIAEVDDSMLLVHEHPQGAAPLSDLAAAEVDDELLGQIWAQLRLAHAAGVAHRSLTSDVILVGPPAPDGTAREVWLAGWDQGDVASSELARRIDTAQLLALLALRVGPERALASAAGEMSDDDVAAIGPLLQSITLPRLTREQMHDEPQLLPTLRTALVARLPEASVEPQQLVRFGARTVLTVLVTAVAIIIVLTSVNVSTISAALAGSDWRWSVLAFVLGLLTLAGAGLTLVAFSPVKLPLWRSTLVQSAATFVALAAPAGIGPAALNLRALTRRGVSGPLAAATVALVQVSQLAVTMLVLLVLSVLSGSQGGSLQAVSPTMLVVVGAIAAVIGVALLVPPVRGWLAAKTMPTLRQTWPRLIQVAGEPRRLALAIGGNVVTTMGYVLAFDACLRAFGQEADLIQVAVVYLAGNAAGALFPTPGGLGTIELALSGGLTSLGINPGIATSVALLFRFLTYWLRIPLGWASMRLLQRAGEL